ncbi:unnamed protein product [Gulo gulo]|uniref:Uncharacterized protein n=1 Tax=Gulo gulo TaxID=48420 RepID=A0A9X9Q3E4_GULGU|nr:unnamed protein product [Gulo gulo]
MLHCVQGKLRTRPGPSDWGGDPQSLSVQQADEHSTRGLGCLYHLTPSRGLPTHTHSIASNMPAPSSRAPVEKQAWGAASRTWREHPALAAALPAAGPSLSCSTFGLPF